MLHCMSLVSYFFSFYPTLFYSHLPHLTLSSLAREDAMNLLARTLLIMLIFLALIESSSMLALSWKCRFANPKNANRTTSALFSHSKTTPLLNSWYPQRSGCLSGIHYCNFCLSFPYVITKRTQKLATNGVLHMTISFPPWHRRHNSMCYLRVLISSSKCTITLHRPFSHCLQVMFLKL